MSKKTLKTRTKTLIKANPLVAAIPAVIRNTTTELLMFFLQTTTTECVRRNILTTIQQDTIRDMFTKGAAEAGL